MSSLPERSPETEHPRHSYDDLFGDGPARPAMPTEPAEAEAAAAVGPVRGQEEPPRQEPLAYDDPAVGEPYLPPAARRQVQLSSDEVREVAEAVPVRAARSVDTGRLYHSAGADAKDTGAIPAAPAARAQSAAAASVSGPAASAVERAVATPAMPAPVGPVVAASTTATPTTATPTAATPTTAEPAAAEPAVFVAGEASPPAATRSASARPAKPATSTVAADRGLTYLGAIVVIGAPTLLAGLAQAIIWNRVGWLAGLVLLLTTAYTALTVRRSDFAAAVVVPPLAFLVTTLVAGQFTLPDGQSLLVREGFMIVRTLAEAAPWILGAAALGAAIVLYRRYRTGAKTSAAQQPGQ